MRGERDLRSLARPQAMSSSLLILRGRKVVGGTAEGEALVTRETISGWGAPS